MNVRGHGLGLSICRQICENLGGSITANSIHGHGSEFIFTMRVENLNYKAKETKSPNKREL